LSETKIFKKSLNRVSKAVFVTAINSNDNTNKNVAQSLGSIILGLNSVSVIGTKLQFFYFLNYYKIIKKLH
jgi:hypothetical protein